MFKWFKRGKPTEESVTWSPPVNGSSNIDELDLCRKCEFAGACRFKDGCSSFKEILANRRKASEALRGAKKTHIDKTKEPRYMRNLSWHERIDDKTKASYRITLVTPKAVTIEVGLRNIDSGKTDRMSDITIEIPWITNDEGDMVVNFSHLRSRARNTLSNMRSKR